MGQVSKLVITIVTAALATAAFADVASAGSTLTKARYLKQGNSICKAGSKEINAVFEELFAGLEENERPTPEQENQVIGEAVPIFRQVLADVEALEGPPALDKKVDVLIDRYSAIVDDIEADPQAAFAEAAEDPFAKADKLARRLGLKACAQA